MKINVKALVEISEEERKRIAIEYLESLLPYNHVLVKREGHYYIIEEQLDLKGNRIWKNEKGPANELQIRAWKLIEQLRKQQGRIGY